MGLVSGLVFDSGFRCNFNILTAGDGCLAVVEFLREPGAHGQGSPQDQHG